MYFKSFIFNIKPQTILSPEHSFCNGQFNHLSEGKRVGRKICACTHCIWKGQACALCCHLPVFVVGLWVRCFSHRPCFSMGRSLSSDRKSTILSGKREGTEGEKGVPWGQKGRQTPPGRHTPIALRQTQTAFSNTHTLSRTDHLQIAYFFLCLLFFD